MRASRTSTLFGGWLAAVACACGTGANAVKAADQPAAEQAAAAGAPPVVASAHRESILDQRVTLLSAELGLDASQQAEVRRILEDQRRQVASIWSDPAVPAAYRVHATRTISDRTGDRIRALLTEEQKAKYNQARKPRESAEQSATPSVEEWMKAANPK